LWLVGIGSPGESDGCCTVLASGGTRWHQPDSHGETGFVQVRELKGSRGVEAQGVDLRGRRCHCNNDARAGSSLAVQD
jgi:hypothetical protein